MRLSAFLLIAASLLSAAATAPATAQTTPVCTGLCLQQVPGAGGTCPAGQTTSISGVIYAPNGTDPLPNVTVYIPNDVVGPLPTGVQCPVVGTPPSGSPLVGAITGVDGSFTITDVPVGASIPLVFISGKWRRQIVIPATVACSNTVVPASLTNFPQNQSQGDIPLFAVATGSVDSVECVLRKVGIQDIEFTDPAGSANGYVGRIQLYTGSGSPGAHVDSATPSQAQLMSNLTTLNQYDVLMLPCQGAAYAQTAQAESNFDSFVNSGGRVYSSHFSYVWMYYPSANGGTSGALSTYTNGPFAGVANWDVGQTAPANGTATINQGFSGGLTLAEWMQQPVIGASTTQGQIAISTLKHDFNGVVSPTQNWMTLNNATYNNPVMQMVFDTPIGATNQCGRVLFNEYHVEAASAGTSQVAFPNECTSGAAMTPQEKLLEFMLFELTDQGGAATLTPTTQDFGTEAISFNSASQPFTVTNNSTFAINSPQITTTGPFSETDNCSSIQAGGTCTINVVFTPTTVGSATGTLSVAAGATNLLANLTGTGTPDLSFSIPNLSYGNVDVGNTATQTFTVTNTAPGAVKVAPPTTTSSVGNDFTVTTNCPTGNNLLAAGASCTAYVTFLPTTTGPITGTISVAGSGVTPSTLAGNGVDFTIVANPASGTVIAGNSISFTTLTSPLAGFSNSVTLTCVTNVPGSTCVIGTATSYVPSTPITSNLTITTTSEYTVVGYGGGFLWIAGLASGAFLLLTRRRAGTLLRVTLALITFVAATTALSGCSGKLPAKNAVYTPAGTYSGSGTGSGGTGSGGTGSGGNLGYTVTATDGFLVHSVNYALTVTVK